MTVTLRTVEANVLEMIRAGISRKEIADKLMKSNHAINDMVSRLSELRAIEKTGKKETYRFLVAPDQYTVSDVMRHNISRGEVKSLPITKDQALYIRGHHKILRRRVMAKRLNVTKLTLNHWIIQLGLESQDRSGVHGKTTEQ